MDRNKQPPHQEDFDLEIDDEEVPRFDRYPFDMPLDFDEHPAIDEENLDTEAIYRELMQDAVFGG